MPNRRRDLYDERSSARYSEDLLAEQRRRKKVSFPPRGGAGGDYQSRLNLQQEQAWATPAPQSLASPSLDRMLEDVRANWAQQGRQSWIKDPLTGELRRSTGMPGEYKGPVGPTGMPIKHSGITEGAGYIYGTERKPSATTALTSPTPQQIASHLRSIGQPVPQDILDAEAQPAGGRATPAAVPEPAGIDATAWGGQMAPITLQPGEDFFQKATPYAEAEKGPALKGRKQEFDRQLSNMLRDRSFFNIEEYQRGGITLEAAGVDIQAHIRDRLFENMPANLRQEYQQQIGERKGIQEAESEAMFKIRGTRAEEAEMRRQAQETLTTRHPMEVVRGKTGKLEYREILGNEKFRRLTLAGQTKIEMDIAHLQTATAGELGRENISREQAIEKARKMEEYYGLGEYEQPIAPAVGIPPAPAPVTPGRGFITVPETGQTVQTGTPAPVPSITGQQGRVTPASTKLTVLLDDPTLTPEQRQSIQAKLNQLQGR